LVAVFFVEKVCPRTCVVYAGDVWFVEYEPEKFIDELGKDQRFRNFKFIES
jgi:hypothetical protein